MRHIIVLVVIAISACSQPGGTSFADRALRAEELEKTPAGVLFITRLLDEHGQEINRFIGECYATSTELEKDSFSLVADMDRRGHFKDIVVQPETAPSRCYAAKFAQIRIKAPLPAGVGGSSFPIVLRINYNK